MFRYPIMRFLFIPILVLLASELAAQGCRNEIKVRAVLKDLTPGDTIISYKKLLTAQEIVAESNGYEILSFTATFGNCPVEFSVTGPKFSDNNRKLFSRLKPGDYVYFSDIRARFRNGPSFCLKSSYYRIVE